MIAMASTAPPSPSLFSTSTTARSSFRACWSIGCHSTTKSPLRGAGTIFGAGHEPDDCNGVDGAAFAVAFLDVDNGTELIPRLLVNRVGNFYTTRALPPTYRVKVISE